MTEQGVLVLGLMGFSLTTPIDICLQEWQKLVGTIIKIFKGRF